MLDIECFAGVEPIDVEEYPSSAGVGRAKNGRGVQG